MTYWSLATHLPPRYRSWPSPCVMLLGGDTAVDVDACSCGVCSSVVSLQMMWARLSSRTYTPALYWHVIVSTHRVIMCVPAQTLTETNVTCIKATATQQSTLMLTSKEDALFWHACDVISSFCCCHLTSWTILPHVGKFFDLKIILTNEAMYTNTYTVL